MSTSFSNWMDHCCRRILPGFCDEADGGRACEVAARVLETDRLLSFPDWHRTSEYLLDAYEEAGVAAEVRDVPTLGTVGDGRWVVREAFEVRHARAEILSPRRRRILDYADNPFHVAHLSAATAPGGVEGPVVILDEPEAIAALRTGELVGKVVLSRTNPRAWLRELSNAGAAAVITDAPVSGNPDAVKWIKLGFGHTRFDAAGCPLVVLVASANQGKKLRADVRKRPALRVRVDVDLLRYNGSHDLVTAVVPGTDAPEQEVWAVAHTMEPGALDNASGVAVCVEAARMIAQRVASGELAPPRRTIRMVHDYEMFGSAWFLEEGGGGTPFAGMYLDVIGSRPDVTKQLTWFDAPPMSPAWTNRLGRRVFQSALRRMKPGYTFASSPWPGWCPSLLADPACGFPANWPTTVLPDLAKIYPQYHSSADTMELLSPVGMAHAAAGAAGYLYSLASMSEDELCAAAEDSFDRRTTAHAADRSRAGRMLANASCKADLDQLGSLLLSRKGKRSLSEMKRAVASPSVKASSVKRADAARVPKRLRPMSPCVENMSDELMRDYRASPLPSWALYWADGSRSLAEIRLLLSAHLGQAVSLRQVRDYFDLHVEIGFVAYRSGRSHG